MFIDENNNGKWDTGNFDNRTNDQNGNNIKSRIQWVCGEEWAADNYLTGIVHATEADYNAAKANGSIYREVYLSPKEGDPDYDPNYPIPVIAYTIKENGNAGDKCRMYVCTLGMETKILLPPNCEKLFFHFDYMTDLSGLKWWDTSQVTNMKEMFSECIRQIKNNASAPVDFSPIHDWDTSNVTNMYKMFSNSNWDDDRYITGMDLSGWDLSNVTNMQNMFHGNKRLDKVLFGGELSSLKSMNWIFRDCSGINTEEKMRELIGLWKLKNSPLLNENVNASSLTGNIPSINGTFTTADGVIVSISNGNMTFSNTE